MSNQKNNYAEAAIVRIKLENFVTYDSLEFSPGSNLNVIIGPNGTGKSTIVCAICLGMTGKPSVLGRANNISDYIKYGKNKAIIEIELNNKKGPNYVIRRDLFKDNRTEWFLNGKQAKLKEIEELVMELNIQVANLCQFLPQEKVAEFARMNPQQLLENTEKAVGGIELYNKHCELKDEREQSKNFEKDLRNLQETLKKEEAINSRLENQVKSYLERKKHKEDIVWLKRKKASINYDDKKKEYENRKKLKDEMSKKLSQLEKKYAPLEEKKNSIKTKIEKFKSDLQMKSNAIRDLEKVMNTCNSKNEELNEKVNDCKNDYQNKEHEFKQRKSKIEELQLAIDALKTEHEESQEELIGIKKKEAEINQKHGEIKQDTEKIMNREHELSQKLFKLRSEKDDVQKKISDLQNVRKDKLKKIRQHYPDAYNAIAWVEANKSKFEGQVFEPIVLMLNMKNQEAAKYIENLIPKKDLICLFLFENSNDMHFFLTEVRDKNNLIVNAALVPKQSVNSFQPSYDINSLKKFGFRSYMREAIDTSDSILSYLCLYYNIHRVPYGDNYTHENISKILPEIPQINRFYTSTHQYSLSKSRYTNKTSSSSSEVSQEWWLRSSADKGVLDEATQKEQQIIANIQQCEKEIARVKEERQKIDRLNEQMKAEYNKLRERRNNIESLEKKIKNKMNLLKQFESSNVDLVAEAKKLFQQIIEISKKRVAAYNNYAENANKLMKANREKILTAYTYIKFQHESRANETELRNYISTKQEIQRDIEQHQATTKQLLDEALTLLREFKDVCGISGLGTDKQIPDEFNKKFEKLPDTIEEIQAKIHEIEAVSQCSYDIDKQVVDDFYARQKKIEILQKDCAKGESKLNNHKNNYEKLKDEWNNQLEEIIKVLNEKFSTLFRMLRCSGEIGLARPDNPEDFDKYGICIKVSFRTEEKLQELTSWQQSGGEKSVSTMLYMIALQEMTKCPFRVVDEINQGMDPINERKVFDIIVQNSSQKTFAQYFLLTPKLLPDLAFDEKTKVICVFNGPQNIPHFKYNLHDFIQRKKKLSSRTQTAN